MKNLIIVFIAILACAKSEANMVGYSYICLSEAGKPSVLNVWYNQCYDSDKKRCLDLGVGQSVPSRAIYNLEWITGARPILNDERQTGVISHQGENFYPDRRRDVISLKITKAQSGELRVPQGLDVNAMTFDRDDNPQHFKGNCVLFEEENTRDD